MGLMCILGRHDWDGCKCPACGKTRDEAHDWGHDCEKCARCGVRRTHPHNWDGCKCLTCGQTRDEAHDWSHNCAKCARCGVWRKQAHQWVACRCTACAETRDSQHNWGDEKCQTCGAKISADELGRRWAGDLVARNDYHALARYFCCWHKTLPGEDYQSSVRLWNAKRIPALAALRGAGSAAVDAILFEMETGEDDHDEYLAKLLVEIGDVRAVPWLKKLVDRKVWSASGGSSTVENFVQKFPQFHGEVEKLACPICGKVRPVTETKPCQNKRFCEGLCWSKRGRALDHGAGEGCPHYAEGVCMAGGRDTGLCSLGQGSYQTSCHVYRLHPAR